MKVNSTGKFEVNYSLLKPLSQNFEVLAPHGITQKWVKKVQIGISCVYADRKMKIKSNCFLKILKF